MLFSVDVYLLHYYYAILTMSNLILSFFFYFIQVVQTEESVKQIVQAVLSFEPHDDGTIFSYLVIRFNVLYIIIKLLMPYANSTGSDRIAHSHSLIYAFIIPPCKTAF